MKRSRLKLLALTAIGSCQMLHASDKPNIIIILADDLGYADLGCQGCEDIATPHIDSIARSGIRFTDGYANHPVCSPSRAALLSGRYQHRFGFEFNSGPERFAAANFGLPRSEKTIAERLKKAGYATGMVGKWHIGFNEGLRPWERGFDFTYVFNSGARSFWPPKDERNPTYRNGVIVEDETEYLTDAFARESVQFIDANKDTPFFLYLAFNAVHAPLESPDSYQHRFPGIKDPDRKTYAGMLSAMDDAVGRVMAKLKEHNLEDNSLVFFLSDNGGPTSQTTSRNDPLKGFKGNLWEGGVRVPFMVQWPDKLPSGKIYENMVMGFDLHATALAAAGLPMPTDKPLDGVNLIPYLTGTKDGKPHDRLFWRSGEDKYAIRLGDWKLVQERGMEPGLYNLKSDIGETNNLIKTHPEVLKNIMAAYSEWEKGTVSAKWIRQDSSNAELGGKLKPQREQQPRQTTIRRRFDEADKDGDGKLSKEEFSNDQLFDRIDKNKDGSATIEEVREFYSNRRAQGAESSSTAPDNTSSNIAKAPSRSQTVPTGRAPLTPLAQALWDAPPPTSHKEETWDHRAGEPPLKKMPPGDASEDAAGRGQLFESISAPGFTDLQRGMNGFAVADLNRDGMLDIVAAYSPARGTSRSLGIKDELRVHLNKGGFFLSSMN